MRAVTEIIIALVLLMTMFFKIDPFHFLMPNDVQMVLLCVFAALLAVYAGVVFREKARDEREAHHLYKASRAGYLVGVLGLAVAIVIEDLNHHNVTAMIIVLSLMIITKLVWLKIEQWRN